MDPISNRFQNLSPMKRALLAMEEMQARLAETDRARTEPIAIIGMGCRFPGSDNPEHFWDLLKNGRDAVGETPASRWNNDDFYDPDPDKPGKMSTRWGGFLDQVDQFDPEFFGISPREAAAMDPQQRLLLEVVWEALENAAQNPRNLATCRTGVFVGITGDEYAQLFYRSDDLSMFSAYFASGIARSVAGGRISYTLGIQGPNLSIDTACSSSLVAIHTASLYLRMGECRMALAGGSNVILSPEIGIAFSKSHMMASDGRCKAFDSRSDGFVRGEGCGIVVLKRLSDAVADGDNILALIRGSAVNQDGHSSGLTVPSLSAQQAVIRQALENAGVQPLEIGYVEAHGTGTSLGDPIEARGLAAELGPGRTADNPLIVGSVKTNLGHLESVSGVAGLIKLVLSLQNEEIPPHLHFHQMNPHIDWGGMPVEIPIQGRAWKRGEKRRVAGLSSFGFSGTNAHLIVEEAPLQQERNRELERPLHMLALSARSEAALQQLVERYGEELGTTKAELADVCYSANAGRAQFEHRVAVSGSSIDEMRQQLTESLPGQSVQDREGIRAAFLFPGQGTQYPGMGKELYDTQPVFRRTLEQCAELLKSELEQPLLEVLWGASTALLDQTAYTQPALFAIEYAMAELWKSWGITPSVVLGHSVGEYVAACVAGVYSLADGLKLIATRARLMQAVQGQGAMVAVAATEEQVREALQGLQDRVSIAAVNAANSVVISGYEQEVSKVVERLRGAGVRVQLLEVSHAFHSPQMSAMEEEFEQVAATVKFESPRVAMISSVTGREMGRQEISAGYWRRQVRDSVRFHQAMETLKEKDYEVFVEAGPGTTLAGLGRQTIGAEECVWATSIKKGRGEWSQVLESLGKLYVRGADVNWAGFDAHYARRRVVLPTYPFERQRYWIEEKNAKKIAPPWKKTNRALLPAHPLLGQRIELAGNPGVCVWENRISIQDLPYLGDHRAFGTVIFPLTGYLEMMTAALAARGPSDTQLRDILIYEPLVLLPDEAKAVQVILRGEAVEIHSREDAAWKLHATAKIVSSEAHAPSDPLSALQQRIATNFPAEEFYTFVAERGMDFGTAFRCIHGLWTGTNESLARVTGHEGEAGAYGIHPALLDGCFQAIGALLPKGDGLLYLPVGLERFDLFKTAKQNVWAHARMRPASSVAGKSVTFDITVLDEEGIVAEARGLEMRSTTAEVLQRHLTHDRESPLFELRWEAKKSADTQTELTGDWLILDDQSGVGAGLAERMSALGARCTLAGESTAVTALERKAWHGVVHCRSLDAAATDSLTLDTLGDSQRLVCGTTLDLVKRLAANSGAPSPQLWLVTRGAQPVGVANRSIAVAQSTLWGMAQAIAEEHPEFHCVCVDLDPEIEADSVASLLREIRGGENEEQVAFRKGERYVARLATKPKLDGLDTPQRLTISSRGIIDNLKAMPGYRRPVPPGCVEIQVDAAGLNFRDVLNVLGMFAGDPGPLGAECAGHIVAVGEGVSGLHEGDDVIAMTPNGGQDAFVIVDARLVALKPANFTAEKSATLPAAFLTVRYTMEYLANIRRGDRVLIHAATGGVGLAAVQIAQRAGAEIFATAGSERKRAYLRSLGIVHVMNSRTVDFAREVLDQTDGRGVDMVLNSLTGEFIAASFSVVAPGGRFIEIGKRDIWTDKQVENLGRNIAYYVVDLGKVAIDTPEVLGELLRDTVSAVERGELKPLPLEIFSFRDAASAYRHMAQALHIGKIVLRQSTCGARISSRASYLIAGGFGGLGLRLARWLVERGAKNVALIGRGGLNPQSTELTAWAEAQGARIVGFRADISRKADVKAVLSEIAERMPPLRGILHTAAVLDDGILARQDWSRFERVLAPKVAGSWILHELTESMPLDFFILFSSMAAIAGAPGQGNYAAANSFEDALAHERRRNGLPAISINWGAWSEGMALREGLEERRRELGLASLSIEEGLALLEYILLDNAAQVGAGTIDWSKFIQRFSSTAVPKRFSNFAGSAGGTKVQAPVGSELLDRLKRAPESSRMGILRDHIQALAVRVLGFSANRRIDLQQPLSELGLDSLMAVEFGNALASSVKQSLPSTLLFSYPAIDNLTEYLAELLFARMEPDVSSVTSAGPQDALGNIEDLSDEEVDRMLAKKLEEAQ